jgi:hypothetical protein
MLGMIGGTAGASRRLDIEGVMVRGVVITTDEIVRSRRLDIGGVMVRGVVITTDAIVRSRRLDIEGVMDRGSVSETGGIVRSRRLDIEGVLDRGIVSETGGIVRGTEGRAQSGKPHAEMGTNIIGTMSGIGGMHQKGQAGTEIAMRGMKERLKDEVENRTAIGTQAGGNVHMAGRKGMGMKKRAKDIGRSVYAVWERDERGRITAADGVSERRAMIMAACGMIRKMLDGSRVGRSVT